MDNSVTEKVFIAGSDFGKGIFSTRDIHKGEIILKVSGKKIPFNGRHVFDLPEAYYLQVGVDDYILPDEPFLYSNHACDPNSGIDSDMNLIARRFIKKGEEIFWDYSTSMLEREWTMKCMCGSPFCRHVILDFDLIPRHVQNLYLQENLVLPFIKAYLNKKSIA